MMKLAQPYFILVMMFLNHQVTSSLVSKQRIWKTRCGKKKIDGSCSKEGSGVGVVIISPSKEVISMSYKLEFETTNNIAECEAFLVGLRAAKDMGIEKIAVFGDYELVIHQVKNIYQTKK
jgi:ribonuclease HI